MAAPKTLPPKEVRTARSSKGGRNSHSLDAHARALVAQWPEATDETRARIRAALAPVLTRPSGSAAK